MEVQVKPKKVAMALTLIVVCLTLAHTLGQFFHLVLGHDYVYGFVPLFNLNMEQNVPTLYASVTLLLCSAMLLVIAAARRQGCAAVLDSLGRAGRCVPLHGGG